MRRRWPGILINQAGQNGGERPVFIVTGPANGGRPDYAIAVITGGVWNARICNAAGSAVPDGGSRNALHLLYRPIMANKAWRMLAAAKSINNARRGTA